MASSARLPATRRSCVVGLTTEIGGRRRAGGCAPDVIGHRSGNSSERLLEPTGWARGAHAAATRGKSHPFFPRVHSGVPPCGAARTDAPAQRRCGRRALRRPQHPAARRAGSRSRRRHQGPQRRAPMEAPKHCDLGAVILALDRDEPVAVKGSPIHRAPLGSLRGSATCGTVAHDPAPTACQSTPAAPERAPKPPVRRPGARLAARRPAGPGSMARTRVPRDLGTRQTATGARGAGGAPAT